MTEKKYILLEKSRADGQAAIELLSQNTYQSGAVILLIQQMVERVLKAILAQLNPKAGLTRDLIKLLHEVAAVDRKYDRFYHFVETIQPRSPLSTTVEEYPLTFFQLKELMKDGVELWKTVHADLNKETLSSEIVAKSG